MRRSLPAFIPSDAEWYLADCVEVTRVGPHPAVSVHINTLLIRADSPAEAHRKAMRFGRRSDLSWRNAAGEVVRTRFLGLAELNVIHEPLEDGSELTYRKRGANSVAAARQYVTPRAELAVFRRRKLPRRDEPDVIEKELRERLDAFLAGQTSTKVRTKRRRRVRQQ